MKLPSSALALAPLALCALAARLPAQVPPATASYSTHGGLVTGPGPGAPGFYGTVTLPGGGVAGHAFQAVPQEMESVTFLGVETARVMPALAAQLGLPEGTGLLVTSLEAGSPAAGAFKTHDILLKLDDQILIVQEQLSVLIRGHKEGDEVTISYLRNARPATARVKLGRHDAPKLMYPPEGVFFGNGAVGFGGAPATTLTAATAVPVGGLTIARQEADRLLSAVPRGPGEEPMVQMQFENQGAPGLRAVSINPANSKLVANDDEGSLELTIKDGQKSLVAKDPKGAAVFSGPVSTPEERKALPAGIRERLEKLEGMQNSMFHTDGQFRGAETRVAVPKRPAI